MLSSADLASMRADALLLMPDTCNLLTVTRTADGQGGFTDAWGTATAGLACRKDYVRGVEVVVGGAVQAFTGWMITLPHDAAITAVQRIEHGGVTYAVKGVDCGKSWQVVTRVAVEVV